MAIQGIARRQFGQIALSALMAAPLAACVGQAYQPIVLPTGFRRYALSSDVLFDFGSATLRPGAYAALADILAQIRATYQYPAIRVDGYTDSIGSDVANDALSGRRAEAVRRYLLDQGLPPAAITVFGYGKRDPVAPNTFPGGADNPEGRAQNRRVVLTASPAA